MLRLAERGAPVVESGDRERLPRREVSRLNLEIAEGPLVPESAVWKGN